MYKVYPLKVGEEVSPGPLVYCLDNWDEKVKLFDYMWLITGDREIILVDTGFTQEVANEFGPGVIQQPNENPLKQLERFNIKPDEISHIIITHAHFDHLSPMIDEFRNAKIIIQRKEMANATNPPHPWFNQFTVKRVIEKLSTKYSGRVKLINGEGKVLSGINVFWTSGHTPGHQSVSVDTNRGKVIITGDVVFTYRNLEKDVPVGLNSSVEECFSAMKRIREVGDIVLPGHDPLVLERYLSGIG